MAKHNRAARALFFMQQCRQHASRPGHYNLQARSYNGSSLDPESFGKKLSLDGSTTEEPIPEWRLPKPDPSKTSSQISRPPPSGSESESLPRTSPYNFPRAKDAPVPRYRHNPAISPGMWGFVKHKILRIAEPPDPRLALRPGFNVLTNPYRAKKKWPPILTHMEEIEQFHYEKKFRRRLLNKTKSMRTGWNRGTLTVQRAMITFMLLYFLFAMDMGDETQGQPADSFRYWFYGQLRKGNDTVWPNRLGAWFEGQYKYYFVKHKRQWDPYNHEGWDESRPNNSLPGIAGPATNRPLESPA